MVSAIDPATQALVSSALNAADLRQLVHASNVAMAGTPGHVPMQVRFGEQFDALREQISAGRVDAATVASLARAEVVPSARTEVQLDQELSAMSQNALHYQALVRLLNKQYSVMGMAIDGGKR